MQVPCVGRSAADAIWVNAIADAVATAAKDVRCIAVKLLLVPQDSFLGIKYQGILNGNPAGSWRRKNSIKKLFV